MRRAIKHLPVLVAIWLVALWSGLRSTPLLAHEMGTIRLSAPQLSVGSPLTLTGAKFTKDAPLKLELRGAFSTLQLAQVRTDDTGAFTLTVDLPAEARAGAYSLVVIADDGDVVARAGFVVLGTPAPAAHAHAGMADPAEGAGTPDMMDLPEGPGAAQSTLIVGLLAVCVLAGSLMVRNARVADGDEGGRGAMKKSLVGGLIVVALAAVLTQLGSGDDAQPTDPQQPAATSPGHDMGVMAPAADSTSAGMTGNDHSGMAGMARARAGATPADDHSTMPGMAAPGADHAAMAAMQRRPSAGPTETTPAMDHGTMAGMETRAGRTAAAREPSMPAMDHGAMAGMAPAGPEPRAATDADATEKLRRLAALLVQDPAVQAEIRADPELEIRWRDEGVQATLRAPSLR